MSSFRERRYAMKGPSKRWPYAFADGERQTLVAGIESTKREVLDAWFRRRASWTIGRGRVFTTRYCLVRKYNFFALYVCEGIAYGSPSICLDGQGNLLWCYKARFLGLFDPSNQGPVELEYLRDELRKLLQEGLATM